MAELRGSGLKNDQRCPMERKPTSCKGPVSATQTLELVGPVATQKFLHAHLMARGQGPESVPAKQRSDGGSCHTLCLVTDPGERLERGDVGQNVLSALYGHGETRQSVCFFRRFRVPWCLGRVQSPS